MWLGLEAMSHFVAKNAKNAKIVRALDKPLITRLTWNPAKVIRNGRIYNPWKFQVSSFSGLGCAVCSHRQNLTQDFFALGGGEGGRLRLTLSATTFAPEHRSEPFKMLSRAESRALQLEISVITIGSKLDPLWSIKDQYPLKLTVQASFDLIFSHVKLRYCNELGFYHLQNVQLYNLI